METKTETTEEIEEIDLGPAEIIINSDSRLEIFFYDSEAEYESGQKSETNKYSFTYLYKPNKVVMTMHTPGYLPTNPVTGKCKVKTLNNNLSPRIPTSKKIQKDLQNKTKLEISKKECSLIGYKIGTEKYADCVMQLMEKE